MKNLYKIILLIVACYSTNSVAQIVANNDTITAFDCPTIISSSFLSNDTLNGSPIDPSTVTITIISNPNNFTIETYYGTITVFPSQALYGQITYQICENANPSNCATATATVNVTSVNIPNDDNFSSTPISNTTGGSTASILANDPICPGVPYNISYYPPIAGITINDEGIITVASGTIPGTYILYCDSNYGNPIYFQSIATLVVTGYSDVVANYDDFSNSNYPNTTTSSVFNNDTINGNPITASNVVITGLNTPSGFTINSNGTITIAATVSEGAYFVPYQICSVSNATQCSVNYAYIVVFKNRILGKIKFDDENDGCDATDAYKKNVPVKNVNGTTTYSSSTNFNNDQYYLIGNEGTNTVSVNLPSYFTVTPTNQVFNFTTPSTVTAADFCVTVNASVNDLEVVVVPRNRVIPGITTALDVVYKNNGSTMQSGQVTFQFDATKMSFVSSNPSPTSIVGNLLTYDFSNLDLFERRKINNITFQVAIPPTVDSGTTVLFTGNIVPNTSDATPINNVSLVSQTAVNSYDPNDITVHEGSAISLAQAQQDYLHYTIRFQNIGTSEAINVKVVNELDPKLDWNTFELISSSHNCRIKNKNEQTEFLFEGINLPGSNNEPLSHGYITYKVKPVSAIALGDIIANDANIYFDFNAPIQTNTATTTVSDMSNQDFAFNDLKYYPNPIKNSLFLSNSSLIGQIEIISLLGQKIVTKKINQSQTELNLSDLSRGVYFLNVFSEGKTKTVKIIKE